MQEADYIIVGAGSAGCALAHQLSGSPDVSVMLVEAGGPIRSPFIDMPRGVAKAIHDRNLVWDTPVRKPRDNTTENWLRGRVVGGSSAINGMTYYRGFPAKFDQLGLEGWDWKTIRNVYEAMESNELADGSVIGTGPLRISQRGQRTSIHEDFIRSVAGLGIIPVGDLNAFEDEVVGYQPRNIWRGRRQSAGRAFIDSISGRTNLQVLTSTLALRIVFSGRRAIGLRVRDASGERTLLARREVILSLGALHSPKLLLLSGIGPASHLRSLGIDVVHDLPGVGENLLEHRLFNVEYQLAHSSQNQEFRYPRLIKNVVQYGLFGTGIMTTPVFEVAALIKSNPAVDVPNGKISFGAYLVTRQDDKVVVAKTPGATALCYPMYPRSRGRIRLNSMDPDENIDVVANYLSEEQDQQDAVDIFRRLRTIMASEPLKKYQPRELLPGNQVVKNDEIVDAYLRFGSPGLHAVGTCRMGHDGMAVVDARLHVHGVDALRVADLSVLPQQVSSNSNAQAMAIGWRAAQIISEHRDTS